MPQSFSNEFGTNFWIYITFIFYNDLLKSTKKYKEIRNIFYNEFMQLEWNKIIPINKTYII